MTHVAVVKTTSGDQEVGRWTFGGGEGEDLAVTGVETDNEFDQALYDEGVVKTLRDFRMHVIGSRGTAYFEWEDGDRPEPGQASISEALGALRKRGANKSQVEKDAEVELSADGDIAKTDEAKQMMFGWAYVTHDREGNVNVDKSGDFIDAVEEIEKAAYDFVLSSRAGDFDHTNLKSAEMVESMVFTPEKIEKMGLPQGSVPLGWWIGFHIPDKADWEVAKTKKAFSVHGKGTRKAWTEDK